MTKEQWEKKQRNSALNGSSFIVSMVSKTWSADQARNWVLLIVDDPRADVAHLPAAQCRHWFYEQAGLHIPAKMLHLPIWFTMVPCFCRGGFTESTVVGKGNLLHITVPLGSKASLITVTIPPLMKYPSVSLAASWTLSTLIIYKINKSCENNLR